MFPGLPDVCLQQKNSNIMSTDLIIIGSGPGGYRAAEYAAQNGLSVVIAERGQVGGTCLNHGCIPTKTYARNAELMDALREAGAFGLAGLGYEFDFGRVVSRKDSVLAQLRGGIETLLASPGITLVRGEATFKDSRTVIIGGEEYTARNIIIATGSEPKALRLEEEDSGMVCNSDWLLSTTELPSRICIVGAGVIGMEFACILNSFGCEVTVVEFLKECLPALDSDIAKRLRKVLEKRGVTFHMQSAVKAVKDGTVIFERKGKRMTVEADKVLMAVGRTPNTDGMSIEASGVAYDHKGIAVDDNMQTGVAGIYAIGDVNGRQMLAHAATMQGIRAVNHILGRTDDIRLDIMPAAIFTNPEAASVGASEDYCKEHGIDYTCGKAHHRANGKALAMNETEGMIKLIADGGGRIIGCHAFGAHSADIVQEASALMCRETTVEQLRDMVHIHPTLGEMLQECAERMK